MYNFTIKGKWVMEDKRQEFIDLIKQNVHREGVDKFLEWLDTTDFFTAPASTKFHSNYEGGLCQHSINVFNRLVKLLKSEYGEDWTNHCSIESATLMGLLHDICKVNTFVKETRNVKEYHDFGTKQDSKGKFDWTEKEVYSVEDSLPYGHGEKSVYILTGFFKLTRMEAMAINWHMGGFDYRVKGGSFALSDVFYNYPVAFLLHNADMQATYLDETCRK